MRRGYCLWHSYLHRQTSFVYRSSGAPDAVIALAFTGIAMWAYVSIAGSEQGLRDKDSLLVVLILFQTLPPDCRPVGRLTSGIEDQTGPDT